jgi:hypothetical protein
MARLSTFNRVRFRLLRAEATWLEVVELARTAGAQPNYCGPDVASFERIADDISALRVEIRSWAFDEALRRPSSPAFRGLRQCGRPWSGRGEGDSFQDCS